MGQATKEQVMREVHTIDVHATCEDGQTSGNLIIHTSLVDEVGNLLLQKFDNVWETGRNTVTVMISVSDPNIRTFWL